MAAVCLAAETGEDRCADSLLREIGPAVLVLAKLCVAAATGFCTRSDNDVDGTALRVMGARQVGWVSTIPLKKIRSEIAKIIRKQFLYVMKITENCCATY